MKTFKIFESAIIGLLIGVVVSTYILFMENTGRFVGDILNSISLTPVFDLFPVQYQSSISIAFIFYVLVYIAYVMILNLIFRFGRKIGLLLFGLIFVLLIGVGFQQKEAFDKPVASEDYLPVHPETLAFSQSIKKYFGEEVFGDLNGDNKEDVAFLIKRNEGDERGEMYYLSASLKTGQGYTGANLLYVDEGIVIKSIIIENQIIKVSYIHKTEDEEEADVKVYFAKFNGSVLEEVEKMEDQEVVEEGSSVQ